MDRWKGIINDRDVAGLYEEMYGKWLLLEVVTMGENEKGKEFRLISYNENKEKLYELMESEDWDWEKKYVFVFADPDSLCEL